MPTYEYACEACAHQFEKFESIKAEPAKLCPKCGKKKLRRLIGTGAGIIFKGSGFYCTDYRSPSYNSAAKSDSTAKGGSSTPAPAGAPATTSATATSPAATTAAPAAAAAPSKSAAKSS